MRHFQQQVASVRDGAHGNHNQPSLKGIDLKLGEGGSGKDRKNDGRQQKELREVKISAGGTRCVKPSSVLLSTSRNMLITVIVVAIQI
jgi:hypothetical protein